MPQIREERIWYGTVVGVGSGRVSLSGTLVPLEVRKNDRIAFDSGAVVEIKHEGETFFLLHEDGILCVLK